MRPNYRSSEASCQILNCEPGRQLVSVPERSLLGRPEQVAQEVGNHPLARLAVARHAPIR